MKHPQKIRDRIKDLDYKLDIYLNDKDYSDYWFRCLMEKKTLNAVLYDLDFGL